MVIRLKAVAAKMHSEDYLIVDGRVINYQRKPGFDDRAYFFYVRTTSACFFKAGK
jgi:hypothetical protein